MHILQQEEDIQSHELQVSFPVMLPSNLFYYAAKELFFSAVPNNSYLY